MIREIQLICALSLEISSLARNSNGKSQRFSLKAATARLKLTQFVSFIIKINILKFDKNRMRGNLVSNGVNTFYNEMSLLHFTYH